MKSIVKAITGSGLLIAGSLLYLAANGKGAIIALAIIVFGIICLLSANINSNDESENPSDAEKDSNKSDS